MTALLPLGELGAVEHNGVITFGVWLPWVSANDGNRVSVKIIHERDQFLQNIPAREFPMTHSVRQPHGDFWSATIAIAGTPPGAAGSAWGTPGRYVYRYQIDNPNVGVLDWIIDPCAREFGVGKLSAFTLGYTRLRYRDNPFMGPFAKDYFSSFGKSTDFTRQLTREYFFTVNHHWLTVYHVDGFRYDCVPNYWDGPIGVGYANLVYETHQLTKTRIAQGTPYWNRFDGGAGSPLRLIQCAEQLEAPEEILRTTYSNTTWQNRTLGAAKNVARGDRGDLTGWGLSLGLFGYPEQETINGETMPKTALQYIENHDHERFICNFGLVNPDEAGNPLFFEGDRSRWFKLQPYLIALAMSKGTPMFWQGQEFAENYFLPDFGAGRVGLLRSVRWDFFYDEAGRSVANLVRKLLRIRRARSHIRTGSYFFFNDLDQYQSRGVLLFARFDGPRYTLVGVNVGSVDQTIPFWFPIGGDYVEELHGGSLNLYQIAPLQETSLTLPSNYGRIWTAM
jgi:1,4-alpha-glucan branching enzyme